MTLEEQLDRLDEAVQDLGFLVQRLSLRVRALEDKNDPTEDPVRTQTA